MQANACIQEMGKVTSLSTLLLDGEPGVGKSYLGLFLAWRLGAELIRFQAFPGCNRDDLLFDRSVLTEDGRPTDGVLLQAMRASQKNRTVLLFEEIDKTAETVDSLLLNFLQDGQLQFPQVGRICADQKNLLVVITKNDVRKVSYPLMRRCRVAYMSWPSLETETTIVKKYWPVLIEQEIHEFLEVPRWVRNWPSMKKKPAINEIIRLIGDMLYLLPHTSRSNLGRYYLAGIAPDEHDQEILAKERPPDLMGEKMMKLFGPVLDRLDQSLVSPLISIPDAIRNEHKTRHLVRQ